MNQYAQQHGLRLEWGEVSCTGPSHQSTFVVRLTVGGRITVGQGTSKKFAREDAAKNMMEQLHGEGYLESVSAQNQRSPISVLQELCQKNGKELPRYSELSRSGPPNEPTFTFSVTINHPTTGEEMTVKGDGRSKDKAKTKAATAMLELVYVRTHQSPSAGYSTPATWETGKQYMPPGTDTSEVTSRLSRPGASLFPRGSTEVQPEVPVPKPRARASTNTAAQEPLSYQSQTIPTAHTSHQLDGSAIIPGYVNPLQDPNSTFPNVCVSASCITPPPAHHAPTHPFQSCTDQSRQSVLSDLGNLPDLPSIDAASDHTSTVQGTEASITRPIPKPRTNKSVASTVSSQETKREDGLMVQAKEGHSIHAAGKLSTVPTAQTVPRAIQPPPPLQTVHVAQANTAPCISDIPDTGCRPLWFVQQQTTHLGALKTVPLEGKDQNDRYVCFLSLSHYEGGRTMTAIGAGTSENEAEDDAARCLWRQLTGQGKIVR